jgi:hypothetical protein
MSAPMTSEEYRVVQGRVLAIARMAYETTDIDRMLVLAERADAIGPILDPTLWRETHRNLELLRELAGPVQQLKAIVERHRPRLLAEFSAALAAAAAAAERHA